MAADIALALLDGHELAPSLAERTGLPVTATTERDHLEVAGRLGADGALVVGLSPVPWPRGAELHAAGSATLPAYTGVVSWHALADLHDRLAQAIAGGVAADAHVLVTAPDPGPDTDPQDVIFLREVAEALAQRIELPSRSIAWRGGTRTPTAVAAVESLVTSHGRRDILECPVAPGTTADPELEAVAARLGARIGCADLGRATQLDLLTAVVRTVAGHEGMN